MLQAEQINKILGIEESYKAPTVIMDILKDKKKRENSLSHFPSMIIPK